MRSARTVAGTVATSLLLVGLASPPTVAADPSTDGFWYFDAFHVQEAHDAGWTGEGVTIAVIDGQINLDVPTLQGADIEVQPSVCWDENGDPIPATTTDPSNQHATNVVSYLVGSGAGYPGQTGVKGIAPDAKIIFSTIGRGEKDAVCLSESGGLATPLAALIFAAIDAGADIISISQITGPDPLDNIAIAEAVHKGIVILAGVPNTADGGFWPNEANGIVSVQSAESDGEVSGDAAAHENEATDVVGPGVQIVWQGDTTWEQQRYARGTSIATPIVAGFLALVAQKYPDATGNQLIQTLVRNTGVEDHELTDDGILYGYGIASVTHMLRVDPTSYEDVNLLIADGDDLWPSRADIENPPARDSLDFENLVGDSETSEPAFTPYEGGSLLPLVLGGLGLLIVIGIIILVVVLATRRARTTPSA